MSGINIDDLRFLVDAQTGCGPLWQRGDDDELIALSTTDLPLSERLVVAITDWAEFFDEINGELSDPEVADEFVSQGFKIAHRLRAEVKGSTVHLIHPVDGNAVEILRTGPR